MINLTILVIGVTVNLLLGLVVLFKGKRDKNGAFFFLLTLALAGWAVANYYSIISVDKPAVLFWMRSVMTLAVLQSGFFLCFALTFSQQVKDSFWKWRYAYALAGLLVLGITQSKLLFSDVIIDAAGSRSPVVQPGMLLFLIFAVGSIVIGVLSLARRYRKSSGDLKGQLNLLLGGIVTMFLLMFIFNVVFVFALKIDSFVSLGSLYTLPFVGATTYAILTDGLFDVRVFISKAIVFTALIALTVAPFAAIVIFLGSRYLAPDSAASFLPGGLAALLIGFAFEPLRRTVESWTEAWLFRKDREREDILRALAQELNLTISLDEAADTVMRSIVRIFRLSRAVVYVFQTTGEKRELSVQSIRQTGYDSTARLVLGKDDFCMEYFAKNAEVLLLQDLEQEISREQLIIERRQLPETKAEKDEFLRDHAVKSAVSRKMEYVHAEVAIPLQLSGQPIGLIFLPGRSQGFSPDDLRLLDLIGGQAVNSIQKTKLYEGDQMKNQFVSVASHELLTPIASIEGYLTLILNDKEAEASLDDQTRGYLRNVKISTERLSALVKDILSVSRIEQGKIKIEPTRIDVVQAIRDTVSQLQFIAQDHGVELIVSKSIEKKPVPNVWADSDRTIQVLVNLVSNAIKYNRSEGGTVTIDAQTIDGGAKVEVTVKDNGIGMNKTQMAHLFEKFYRVDSPQTAGVIGTGLGLYITKAMIERMGGIITVKSEEGKGTAFSFTLPTAKA